MDVFKAAKIAENHVLNMVTENTVQSNGVLAIGGEAQVLKFGSVSQAINSTGGSGWVFSWRYRNGSVEVTPEN